MILLIRCADMVIDSLASLNKGLLKYCYRMVSNREAAVAYLSSKLRHPYWPTNDTPRQLKAGG